MSMFHELMMRKKEQIMYATIKGTLTENDGVFSGFTRNSDYLKLQNNFTLSNDMELEINIRFKTPSELGTTNQYLLGINASDYSGYMGISYNSSAGQFETRLPNIQGGSYSSYPMTANTYYSVKSVIKNNTVQTLLYDANNVLLTQTTVKTFSANWSYTTQLLTLGAKTDISASAVLGSIDLNNSYIKLGSTKYKLQAVVGYTVVGSLTESPSGVFSGFSSANYLTTAYGVFPDFEEDFELQIKFTTGANVSNSLLIGTNTSLINGFRIVSSQLNMTLRYDTAKQNTVSYTLVANTTYYAKALKKGTSLICSLYDENKVLLATNTTTLPETDFSKGNYMYIGYGTSGAFEGSIYLNETYIKINNKLWFNGQQA